MKTVFFTTKVAEGATFCNREQETIALTDNVAKNHHTVVVAPRRYGKTSLITHALSKCDQPFVRIDLFCVVYEEDVCLKIAKGISSIIKEIASFSEKTIRMLEQCFKSAYIALNAGQLELKIELNKTTSPVHQIEDLLQGLEMLAAKHKTPVVLFFDEFQDVLKVDESNKIQAAIRSVAQHSKYVTYLFSGSSRIMLNKIFDDKKQPLYMLCGKIMLERISVEHFEKHIQKAAHHQWKRNLPKEIVTQILEVTELHSYYVNLLCNKLWSQENVPTLEDVQKAWDLALQENKGKIIADLEPLNSNRIKVLLTIALLDFVNEPNSKIFLDQVKLSLSSTQGAVQYLMNNDYIFESAKGLTLVDPLMKKFIVDRYHN